MLHFMVMLFQAYIYLTGTTDGIQCHVVDDIRKLSEMKLPTAKTNTRNVLQYTFGHVNWNQLILF